MTYLEQRRKHIESGRPLPEKKKYTIAKKSPKRLAKELAEKEVRGDKETDLQKWFNGRRKNMVGVCQCGCGQPSQKKDDMYFRHSACHIFPQRIFESVKNHPLNFVERAFFGGCHSVMDDTSMDRWVGMADWDDIVEKFHQIAPLLTDADRATKFYRHLEKLVYEGCKQPD